MAYDNEIIVLVTDNDTDPNEEFALITAAKVEKIKEKMGNAQKRGTVINVTYDPKHGFSKENIEEIKKLSQKKSLRIQIISHSNNVDTNLYSTNTDNAVSADKMASDICNILSDRANSSMSNENEKKLRISLKCCYGGIEKNEYVNNTKQVTSIGQIFVKEMQHDSIPGTVSARNDIVRPSYYSKKDYVENIEEEGKFSINIHKQFEQFILTLKKEEYITEDFVKLTKEELIEFIKKTNEYYYFSSSEIFEHYQYRLLQDIQTIVKNNIHNDDEIKIDKEISEIKDTHLQKFYVLLEKLQELDLIATKAENRKTIYSTSGKITDADTGKLIENTNNITLKQAINSALLAYLNIECLKLNPNQNNSFLLYKLFQKQKQQETQEKILKIEDMRSKLEDIADDDIDSLNDFIRTTMKSENKYSLSGYMCVALKAFQNEEYFEREHLHKKVENLSTADFKKFKQEFNKQQSISKPKI